MLRTSLLTASLIFIASASVQAMPSIHHSTPSGSDRVRTSDGASCEQSVATGKSVVMGVYGADNDGRNDFTDDYNRYNNNDVGLYAGIQIQFGGPDRIDCKRMYDNEMARKDIELDMLKTQHEQEKVLLQQEIERLRNRGALNFSE